MQKACAGGTQADGRNLTERLPTIVSRRVEIRCCPGPEQVMAVLCDTQIRELIGIEPFEENGKRPGKVSYGVSSYGYDVRVGSIFKIFTNVSRTGGQAIVD